MRNNNDGKRLVGRIRKYYKADDFQVTASGLSVGKDCYRLSKIKRVEVRKLGWRDNAVNIVSLALVLSAATWAFVPQFGFIALALTFVIGFSCWRKHELRAEFIGTDETGDHWVALARGCTKKEYQVFKDVELALRNQK
ncbi:DUF6232 family protein [Vibrio ouci]|uniref:Uncharacterized protein n=1 Tax=Vibrio ouci TaxID=2499078 RepID=A0A4Y8WEB3_9VIBR|nr:DUF6232 family protein [Vibrio ouci]TFH90955.1 hypothetical protein ELS82_14600 [Vibrio ouci]